MWLGGDDIDTQIIKFVKEQVAKQEELSDIDGLIAKMPHYQQARFMADLKMAVERAKIELSNANVAQIFPATPLLDELGIAVPVGVELTREQFEAMIMPLVERSIKICHEALHYSEYPPDMVDVVLLVGGSSQIPLVQRKVQQAFGTDKVVVHPRPMYAAAEGAAIVAAGLTDSVTTVSRDYFIKLPSNPRYKVISRGDILPVTTVHTFKTVADGQRLIHFEFFSPDDVKESSDGVRGDERIGKMWLGLDQYYPQGTEIMVYLELDEKNSDLKITATLKNDPSVRVSCTFSRGRSDETIYRELEQAIEDLNALNLPAAIVEETMKLVVPVIQATNQIIDVRTGEERIDMSDRAQAALKTFKIATSKERLEAESLVNECKQLIELCAFPIPQPQQDRLQKLKSQLEAAIESNNESAMQSLSEDAKQEIRNLSNEVPMGRAVVAQSTTINTQMISNPNHNFLNPYDILGVSQAASKAEITKAVAVAMKRKQYPVDAIAKAQKSLMKSEERIIADYLRPILPIIKRFKSTDLSALNQPAPTLALLSEFDGLESAIASSAKAERLEREPLVNSLEVSNV